MNGFGGEMPLGVPLVVQTVFVMKKITPSAPKVRPRTKNEPKMNPENPSNVKKSFKKSSENEKELQKLTFFHIRVRRIARSAYSNRLIDNLMIN